MWIRVFCTCDRVYCVWNCFDVGLSVSGRGNDFVRLCVRRRLSVRDGCALTSFICHMRTKLH